MTKCEGIFSTDDSLCEVGNRGLALSWMLSLLGRGHHYHQSLFGGVLLSWGAASLNRSQAQATPAHRMRKSLPVSRKGI